MSTADVEQRLEALESKFAELLKIVQPKPAQDAWRQVVGMFADDPQIELLHKETERLRQEDRSATRDGSLGE